MVEHCNESIESLATCVLGEREESEPGVRQPEWLRILGADVDADRRREGVRYHDDIITFDPVHLGDSFGSDGCLNE